MESLNERLAVACADGELAVAAILLRLGADPFDYHCFPIKLAIEFGHTEVVRILLTDKRFIPIEWIMDAKVYAERTGYTEIVEMLKTYIKQRTGT